MPTPPQVTMELTSWTINFDDYTFSGVVLYDKLGHYAKDHIIYNHKYKHCTEYKDGWIIKIHGPDIIFLDHAAKQGFEPSV